MVVIFRPGVKVILLLARMLFVAVTLITYYEEERKRLTKENRELRERINELTKDPPEPDHRETPKIDQNDLPPILQPGMLHILRNIVSHMDTKSFLRFIKSCKAMHTIAKAGMLKKKTVINCKKSCDFNLLLDGFSLGHQELTDLKNSKWFVPTIGTLDLDIDFEPDNNIGIRLKKLLEFTNAKSISEVFVQGDFDIDPVLEKFNVETLHLWDDFNSRIVLSENIKKVRYLRLADGWIPDDVETKSALETMILSSSIATLDVNFWFSTDTVLKLVKAWLSGSRTFEWMEFWTEDSFSNLFPEIQNITGYPVLSTEQHLSRISSEDIKKLDYRAPALIKGEYNSAVLVREDETLLRISIDYEDFYVRVEEIRN